MFDILIANGTIVDGSGEAAYKADIGIMNGKIEKIGALAKEQAHDTIDAAGKCVSPGFFDIHSHIESVAFDKDPAKLLQGVTTELFGVCGTSCYPVNPDTLYLLKNYLSAVMCGRELAWNWRSLGEFMAELEKRQPIINYAAMVGQGTVRIHVMGMEKRVPTDQEMAAMKRLLAETMDEGAFGLSTGLVYPPGLFSQTSELIELAKVVGAKGGFYASHIRNETDEVIDAVKELIEIAEKAGLPGHISHHKTGGKKSVGASRITMGLVEEARARGVDITCDVYPYTAASTHLGALLPPWVQEGGLEKTLARLEDRESRKRITNEFAEGIPGWQSFAAAAGWENVVICFLKKNKEYQGKSIAQIAAIRGMTPEETVFDLMEEERGDVFTILHMMAEDDVVNIMKNPVSVIGSDGLPSKGLSHPRFYGTFPRVLCEYVRKRKVLTLPEAIHKMTGLSFQRLGIKDRGLLKEGMWADVVVFDPETVEDKATYEAPNQYPVGIESVVVNGRIAVRNGKYTGELAGKVLRKRV